MSDIESQRVLGAGIPRTGRLIDVGKQKPPYEKKFLAYEFSFSLS